MDYKRDYDAEPEDPPLDSYTEEVLIESGFRCFGTDSDDGVSGDVERVRSDPAESREDEDVRTAEPQNRESGKSTRRPKTRAMIWVCRNCGCICIGTKAVPECPVCHGVNVFSAVRPADE